MTTTATTPERRKPYAKLPDPPKTPDMLQHKHISHTHTMLERRFGSPSTLVSGSGYLRRDARDRRGYLVPGLHNRVRRGCRSDRERQRLHRKRCGKAARIRLGDSLGDDGRERLHGEARWLPRLGGWGVLALRCQRRHVSRPASGRRCSCGWRVCPDRDSPRVGRCDLGVQPDSESESVLGSRPPALLRP